MPALMDLCSHHFTQSSTYRWAKMLPTFLSFSEVLKIEKKNAQHFCKTLIDIAVWMVTACTTHPMKTNSVFIFEGRSFYWFEKRADLKSLHDHSEICPFSMKFTFGEYFTCFGPQGFHEIRLQNLTRHCCSQRGDF